MIFNSGPVKEWFGYSRRERISGYILLAIIVIILCVRILLPDKNSEVRDVTAMISFTGNMAEDQFPVKTDTVRPFTFDPNEASYEILIKLGLEKKEANTLISYRKKGGKFRVPGDIKRIYGIQKEKAEELSHFAEIKTDTAVNPGTGFSVKKILLNLNQCDSASLVRLPGIGPVLSARIIRFRHLIGGYARIEQLKEVYGLPEETYNMIKGSLYIDTTGIKRVRINSADYKELLHLPYIEKYEVTAILKYRELKGRIRGIEDLTENKLLTEEKVFKIGPYLMFE